jgi:hypothetical protein
MADQRLRIPEYASASQQGYSDWLHDEVPWTWRIGHVDAVCPLCRAVVDGSTRRVHCDYHAEIRWTLVMLMEAPR